VNFAAAQAGGKAATGNFTGLDRLWQAGQIHPAKVIPAGRNDLFNPANLVSVQPGGFGNPNSLIRLGPDDGFNSDSPSPVWPDASGNPDNHKILQPEGIFRIKMVILPDRSETFRPANIVLASGNQAFSHKSAKPLDKTDACGVGTAGAPVCDRL
jgi:hypothetical protein